MQRTGNPENTCLWWPCATPTTACFVQAVVLSAVVAIVFQFLLSFVVDVPAVYLQLTGFVSCLLVAWQFQSALLSWLQPPVPVRWLRFGPQGIDGELDEDRQILAFEVVEVGRFWGAMVIKLKPATATREGNVTDTVKSVSITLWRSVIGKDLFRKISVLTLWHARGVT